MKICGFTIIRNGVKFDYPFIEAITSILPICDKFVVACGSSEDTTIEKIKEINSDKIEIINTVWDDSLREGGKVLALETNKAFDAIGEEYDWAFYIQGDEVIHEKYLPAIRKDMELYLNHLEVEGLLFNYLHFNGTYDYVANSRNWYRREIRIIRNNKKIRSYKDAQGFRFDGVRKLNVKHSDSFVYHYGWVKNPKKMLEKQQNLSKMWHDDKWVEENFGKMEVFDYSGIDRIKLFNGTHPAVMSERINSMNWHLKPDPNKTSQHFHERLLHLIENITGYRLFEYKNYKII